MNENRGLSSKAQRCTQCPTLFNTVHKLGSFFRLQVPKKGSIICSLASVFYIVTVLFNLLDEKKEGNVGGTFLFIKLNKSMMEKTVVHFTP